MLFMILFTHCVTYTLGLQVQLIAHLICFVWICVLIFRLQV